MSKTAQLLSKLTALIWQNLNDHAFQDLKDLEQGFEKQKPIYSVFQKRSKT